MSWSGAAARLIRYWRIVPPMLADKVGGDPVQPRRGAGVAEVVLVPLAERGQERLGDQVVGDLPANAPGEIPMNVRGVAIEHHGEPLRLLPGTLDDRRIVRPGERVIPGPSHKRPDSCSCPFGCAGGYTRYNQVRRNGFTADPHP